MKPSKRAEEMGIRELAAYIDQSVLKPEFTQDDIKRYTQEGIDYGCATICINPASIDLVSRMVKGTSTGICVVCDFPFGLSSTKSKVKQAQLICQQANISDLDIVANYGWIRSGLWEQVEKEIRAVAKTCHDYGTILKTIFEVDALTIEEIKQATEVAINAGTDFVKTSTGFYTGGKNEGATIEVVTAMIEASNGRCKIKGAGGIRTQKRFFEMINLGIDRMGIGFRSTPIVLGKSIEDLRAGK